MTGSHRPCRSGALALVAWLVFALAPLACGAPEAPDLDHDIDLVMGGSFTPDSLGPEEFERVRARIRSDPEASLRALAARYAPRMLGQERLGELHPEALLTIVAETDRAAARKAARDWIAAYDACLKQYDTALDAAAYLRAQPEDDQRALQRLLQRREALRRIEAAP